MDFTALGEMSLGYLLIGLLIYFGPRYFNYSTPTLIAFGVYILVAFGLQLHGFMKLKKKPQNEIVDVPHQEEQQQEQSQQPPVQQPTEQVPETSNQEEHPHEE